MGSKLAELSAELDVSDDDVLEMRRQRRRDRLVLIAQVLTPVASAILGIVSANELYPFTRYGNGNGYPLALGALAVGSGSKTFYRRRSWAGSIFLSVALFVIAFVSIALFNTPDPPSPTLYGVYSRESAATGRL